MNKMIPMEAIFVGCVDGTWIDFVKVEALCVEPDNVKAGMFNLLAKMPNGTLYTIQDGFKTEASAKKYIDRFLEAYRKF